MTVSCWTSACFPDVLLGAEYVDVRVILGIVGSTWALGVFP